MRVLFITGEFPPMQGGVGDCTNEIARALAKRGVEASVLTTADGGQTTNDKARATNDRETVAVLRAVKKWDWGALDELRQAISETRADIYHIKYQTAAFGMHPMINFAPRLLGKGSVKSVVTFHDLRPMYLFPKAGRARDWVTFQLARSCNAAVATNEEDFERLEKLGLDCLSLIPIGSNIEPVPPVGFERDTLRNKLGVGRDETLLCYFGFLNDSKGGETLVRALAQIPGAKLLMLGGQTGASDATNVAYLLQVKQLIADLGLTGRVIWTDFLAQPDVSAHFLAADICVLPYRDGASYRRGTFMAALAHGMAIVTTSGRLTTKDQRQRTNDEQLTTNNGEKKQTTAGENSAGKLPVLRDGENVLMAPPDDAGAIAKSVERVTASPELRERLRRGARETAQFFTWDRIAHAHVQLYEDLLGNTSKNRSRMRG